jgi:hypothetical protein
LSGWARSAAAAAVRTLGWGVRGTVLPAVLVVLGGFAFLFVFIVGGQAFPLEIFPGYAASSSFGGRHRGCLHAGARVAARRWAAGPWPSCSPSSVCACCDFLPQDDFAARKTERGAAG